MKPRDETPRRKPRLKNEGDMGYGPSHGYAPGHGGPSGPGDVPADETPQGPASPPPTSGPVALDDEETSRPNESGPDQV